MIKELQKRPFARPLLIWISGILLQVFIPWRISFFLLIFPTSILIYLYTRRRKSSEIYDYEARWLWGGVFLSLLLFFSMQKTAGSFRESSEKPVLTSMQRLATAARQELLKPFDRLNLTEKEKSVLATITLGYRETMKREVKRSFSAVGVAHLLAVSGFHVAIVCGFLSLLVSFLPRNRTGRSVRYLLTVSLLWIFAAITGLAASAVRAALMLTLYLTGRLLRRKTDSYNTLFAAAFCMLVYQPFYLFDIGFQLSYLAVFSILYIQPRLNGLIVVRNPLLAVPWGWITITVAAQLGTTCLCLYYFGQFSAVFLFTNLPLTFIATLLIPAALLWILLPAACPGYGYLQIIVEELTRGMLWIVEVFNRVPGAVFSFRFDLYSMLLGYGILIFALLYIKERKPRLLLVALSLLFLLLVYLIAGKLLLFPCNF